ncbi:hypothetical protein DBB31_12345 [Burkholderia multivorans]|nr:hypothetical protein DBB31_12345 [Burkholderia multivorans]
MARATARRAAVIIASIRFFARAHAFPQRHDPRAIAAADGDQKANVGFAWHHGPIMPAAAAFIVRSGRHGASVQVSGSARRTPRPFMRRRRSRALRD